MATCTHPRYAKALSFYNKLGIFAGRKYLIIHYKVKHYETTTTKSMATDIVCSDVSGECVGGQ